MARGTCTVRVRFLCLYVRHQEECFSPRAHLQAGFPQRTRRSHSEAATRGPRVLSCFNSASRLTSNRPMPHLHSCLCSIYTLNNKATKKALRRKNLRNVLPASAHHHPQPRPGPPHACPHPSPSAASTPTLQREEYSLRSPGCGQQIALAENTMFWYSSSVQGSPPHSGVL